jgi:hypothetical protein
MEADGKVGAPTARQAGVAFNATVYAADQYFNPVVNGPYPLVNFNISPNLVGSFVSGTLPFQMVNGSRIFSVTLQQNSNVQTFDQNAPAINQTVAVPVSAGPLHHFKMVLDNNNQKAAGMPFGVTITAEDQFNNIVTSFNQPITLTPNTGSGTMTPPNVTPINGVYTGNLTVFAASASVRISMSNTNFPSATRDSDPFSVTTSPMGYQKLLMLFPGEILAQGTANGKTGTPTPTTAGTVNIVRALSCDLYYNPINSVGLVQFSSNRYVQFGAAQGDLVNVDGHGEYATTVILRTAATHTLSVRDVNNNAISNSTSSVLVTPGTYRKIQLLAPGEVSDPGTFVPSGKTVAAPLDQRVATPFAVQILAVDDYWNLVAFNGGDSNLFADINSIILNPPNNNGGANRRSFVNGVVTPAREIIVGQQGLMTLSVQDDDNLARPGQSVSINVVPGPNYVFQTPATAVAGQPFPAVTITLEENGQPLVGYNESIFLTADMSSGGPASGGFNPDGSEREYVMTDGAVTITDLTYAYSEMIKIHLRDNLGRAAFSNDINVVPSGLKYRVLVGTSALAGPPSTFNVQVELLEENTNTLVKNHDHEISIQVVSAQNQTTDGQFSVTSANLTQGAVTFQQSYTKAESILVQISESATAGDPDYVIPSRNSNNINLQADGYKKLLIVAPGETHVPGVPSATGKIGLANNRQLDVPFLVQVRGVDQYWNVANEFTGGQILFTSDDTPPSLNANNPVNQNSALSNGEMAANIALNNTGNVSVTVRDTTNDLIGVQSVNLTVGGNYYQIDVPGNPLFSGVDFTMNITLIDSNNGQPVTQANNAVSIQALNPDGSPAAGNLTVATANLSNGVLTILNQRYTIAEDIIFRVTDANNSSGSSQIFEFFPVRVRYNFEIPTQSAVNEPFTVTVRAIDDTTGTEVRNLTRAQPNTLAAMSSITGLPVTGSFVPNLINIVNGVGQVSATYNIAESIFLVMTDPTPQNGMSPPTQSSFTTQGSILITPGFLANIEIADFNMQSNETKTFTILCKDTFGNIIPNQTINLNLISIDLPGFIKMNGQVNNLTASANGQGEIVVTFEAATVANGNYQISLADGQRPNGYSRVLNIGIQGFPQSPSRALGFGENRIPVNSTVFLDINTQIPNGATLRTFYRVNNGLWFSYNAQTGIMAQDGNRGYPVFDTTRSWTVEWYSEICYDAQCTNPVSELTINGAPNLSSVITYQLDENLVGYPSPFNPKGASDENFLTIQYPLAEMSSVEIDIYDLFGRKVWHTDIDAGAQGGEARPDNRVFWFGVNDDGTTVANGGYVVMVKVGATGQRMKAKILVAK